MTHTSLLTKELDEFAPLFKGRRLYCAMTCDGNVLVRQLKTLGIDVYSNWLAQTSTDAFTEVSLPHAALWTWQPDYILLSLENISRKVWQQGSFRSSLQTGILAELGDYYRRSISLIRDRGITAPIWLYIHPYAALPRLGTHEYHHEPNAFAARELLMKLDLAVYEVARQSPGVYVLDANEAIEQAGKDVCLRVGEASGHLTPAGAAQVGEAFLRQLALVDGRISRFKAVAVDLDNTLWAGVLRESEWPDIEINGHYVRALRNLHWRGILVCVVSKNETDEVEQFIRRQAPWIQEFWDTCICAQLINWHPKSQNLSALAEALNIGADSIAFFDDSEFEREEVRANCPAISVFRETDLQVVDQLVRCQPLVVTDVASSRTEKYKQQAHREAARRSAGDFERFLRECEFQTKIRAGTTRDLDRIAELLERTNQMNATLERTSRVEIADYLDEKHRQRRCFVVELADKFGSYGISGVGLFESDPHGTEWQMREFAFSCRAMGRGIENALLVFASRHMASESVQRLNISVTDNSRNKEILRILNEFGFVAAGEEHDSRTRLTLDVPSAAPGVFPPWLHVNEAPIAPASSLIQKDGANLGRDR